MPHQRKNALFTTHVMRASLTARPPPLPRPCFFPLPFQFDPLGLCSVHTPYRYCPVRMWVVLCLLGVKNKKLDDTSLGGMEKRVPMGGRGGGGGRSIVHFFKSLLGLSLLRWKRIFLWNSGLWARSPRSRSDFLRRRFHSVLLLAPSYFCYSQVKCSNSRDGARTTYSLSRGVREYVIDCTISLDICNKSSPISLLPPSPRSSRFCLYY